MYLKPNQVKGIARDCRDYAAKYKCSLHDAIADWEEEAGNGTFGMQPDEKAQVAKELKSQGFDLDAEWDEMTVKVRG